MSFEKISKLLKGDTPGRSVELHYSRIGPDDAARCCVCQKENSDSYRHQPVILIAAFIEVTQSGKCKPEKYNKRLNQAIS